MPDPQEEQLAEGRTRRRRRRRRFALTTLLLIIAVVGGASWWWFAEGPGAYTQVPQLLGLPEDQAVQLLAAAGLEPELERAHHDTVPEGEVFASDPSPGNSVRTDGTVVVHVSRGILMVEVPPLAELTEDDARAALEEAGLTLGEVERPWHQEVPEGTVISATPDAGESVPHTQPVDLVVSAGREPAELVSVVGAERDTAESDLEGVGLVADVSEEHHDSVPAGRVIRQDPPPGADVELFRGDTVSIVVSLGPEPIALPNLIGDQVGPAQDELEAAGFVVDTERLLGGLFGTVHSMEPGPGELAVPGSTVVLRYV